MKRILVTLMAMVLFGALPVLASEHDGKMKMDTKEGVRECSIQAESIQQKIKRLESEVAKGDKKYNANDLKKLNDKLKDANKILDSLTGP